MKAKSSLSAPVLTTVEHKKLKKKHYSIHYFTSGNPENEAIVFLHPAFGDHRCFDQQLDFFSKFYYVITVDLLAHGLSIAGKTDDKIISSAGHIKEILEQEKKVAAHITGVSLGSIIARQLSLKYPDKILSLTVLGGFNPKKNNKEVKRAQILEGIKWLPRILFSMKSFRRYVASVSVKDPVQQARFYESTGGFTRSSFRIMSGMEYYSKDYENTSRSFPLLILYGDQDIDLARRASISWNEEEKGSLLHEIKNAGHCANMDNPEEFNQVLMDFLTTVSEKNSASLTTEN